MLSAVVGVKKQWARKFDGKLIDGKLILVDGKLTENTVNSRQTVSNRVQFCQRNVSHKEC